MAAERKEHTPNNSTRVLLAAKHLSPKPATTHRGRTSSMSDEWKATRPWSQHVSRGNRSQLLCHFVCLSVCLHIICTKRRHPRSELTRNCTNKRHQNGVARMALHSNITAPSFATSADGPTPVRLDGSAKLVTVPRLPSKFFLVIDETVRSATPVGRVHWTPNSGTREGRQPERVCCLLTQQVCCRQGASTSAATSWMAEVRP